MSSEVLASKLPLECEVINRELLNCDLPRLATVPPVFVTLAWAATNELRIAGSLSRYVGAQCGLVNAQKKLYGGILLPKEGLYACSFETLLDGDELRLFLVHEGEELLLQGPSLYVRQRPVLTHILPARLIRHEDEVTLRGLNLADTSQIQLRRNSSGPLVVSPLTTSPTGLTFRVPIEAFTESLLAVSVANSNELLLSLGTDAEFQLVSKAIGFEGRDLVLRVNSTRSKKSGEAWCEARAQEQAVRAKAHSTEDGCLIECLIPTARFRPGYLAVSLVTGSDET